jgi:hypothetical protein
MARAQERLSPLPALTPFGIRRTWHFWYFFCVTNRQPIRPLQVDARSFGLFELGGKTYPNCRLKLSNKLRPAKVSVGTFEYLRRMNASYQFCWPRA